MILTRFLDNVVTWNEDLNALANQRKAAKETRRLGLGVMGIADMLNQVGLGYDSDKGVELIEKIMNFICNAAYQASASLAGEKGPSPIFDYDNYIACPFIKEALNDKTKQAINENGIRNIAIMSIAPTGSISNIVLSYQRGDQNYIGVSSGVEPIFATFYTRRSESFGNKFFKVFHSTVQAYIDMNNLKEDIKDIDNDRDLEAILPEFLTRTAHKIDSKKRVKIQGIIQKYIDHSISSTINLPEDVQPELISDIYLQAWKHKLKGVTIYRDGSRFPILSTEGELSEFQMNKEKYFLITNDDGKEVEVRGDDIMKLSNGSLITMYHYLKNSNREIEEVLSNTKFEDVPSD
jgi:ribonucleoside-diphosphate reductase alpha chain